MNTRLTIRRPGRAAAAVGAVVAVSATTLMALVAGTASASEPGRCIENVNVRAQPDPTSRIVALCEAGTEVQVGTTRNGFVQLTDLGGWSAQEFISVDGAPPAAAVRPTAPADGTGRTTDDTGDGDDRAGDRRSAPAGRDSSPSGSGDTADRDDADTAPTTSARPRPTSTPAPTGRDSEPAPADEPAGSPVGGLLG